MSRSFNKAISDCELIVCDHDGVFYDFQNGMAASFIRAAALAARRYYTFDQEEAENIAWSSWGAERSCTKQFSLFYEIPHDELEQQYFANCDEKMIPINKVLKRDFDDFQKKFSKPLAILTHGPEDWVRRALGRQDVLQYFEGHIYGSEILKGNRKSDSIIPFYRVTKGENVLAKDVIIIEDTPENLILPHILGMTTILITHGRPIDPQQHSHVDFVFADLHEFMEAACKSKAYVPGTAFSMEKASPSALRLVCSPA